MSKRVDEYVGAFVNVLSFDVSKRVDDTRQNAFCAECPVQREIHLAVTAYRKRRIL